MKHESHIFAWLKTSKKESSCVTSPHEMPDVIIYHLGLFSNCTLIHSIITLRKKSYVKKVLNCSLTCFCFLYPWLPTFLKHTWISSWVNYRIIMQVIIFLKLGGRKHLSKVYQKCRSISNKNPFKMLHFTCNSNR